MLNCLLDALLDTVKILPYLALTFLLLELIEHKLGERAQRVITKYQKAGPVIGGVLGGFPQCGFSAMMANLFTNRVVTMGTLVAVFLSTSDEMLPVMISQNIPFGFAAKVIGIKVAVGIIAGIIVDLILKSEIDGNNIHHMCEKEHCHCKNGIVLSSLIHTAKTGIFILAANILINFAIFFIGTDALSVLLQNNNILVYFASGLIGLIPNCAASVVITQALLSGVISLGVALTGLLTGSGIGILLLFKNNKSVKENLTVLSVIYGVGIIVGYVIDLL